MALLAGMIGAKGIGAGRNCRDIGNDGFRAALHPTPSQSQSFFFFFRQITRHSSAKHTRRKRGTSWNPPRQMAESWRAALQRRS